MSDISIRDLVQVGAHFGHQSRYWNPKMQPYIYGTHSKVHIIDLDRTLPLLQEVLTLVRQMARQNKKILFVGTKRAASSVVREQAIQAGMPYVDQRWLGGMLTNYKTVRQSIHRLRNLEERAASGGFAGLTKHEMLVRQREINKLDRAIGGVKNMAGLPDALFVVDVDHERIAVTEANKLGIPVIAIVDTNSDPDGVQYIIPGNDDSSRAINLYTQAVVDAISAGHGEAAQEVSATAADPAATEHTGAKGDAH